MNSDNKQPNPMPAPLPPQQNNLNPDPVHPGSTPTGSPQQQPVSSSDQTDILGIISLVMIMFFPPIGIVLGIFGLKKANKEGYSNILSKIGLIVNSVSTVLLVIFIVIWLALFAFVSESIDSEKLTDELDKQSQITIEQNSLSANESYKDKRLYFALPATDSEWSATIINQGGTNSYRSNTSSCSITTYQRAGADRSKSQGRTLSESLDAQANLTTNYSAQLPMSDKGSTFISVTDGNTIAFDTYETSYNNNIGILRVYGAWVSDSELMITVGCLTSDWYSNTSSINAFVDKIKLTTL